MTENTAFDFNNNLSTMRLRERDGSEHIIERAAVVGIWDGHLLVNSYEEAPASSYDGKTNTVTTASFKVHTSMVDAAQVESLEIGVEGETSETLHTLEVTGLVAPDWSLDVNETFDLAAWQEAGEPAKAKRFNLSLSEAERNALMRLLTAQSDDALESVLDRL